MGSLYLCQGLPFGFFTQALPVLLRQHGHTLTTIGLSSLLAIPWALKFLWAPLVDRYGWPRVGRRKSWIVPLQLATALVLCVTAAYPPARSMGVALGLVFVVNLLSATQDIATDGLAVDVLRADERGFANGVQVGGYRVGMIIGGGVLLVLCEWLGWAGAMVTMAILIVLGSVPILLTRERAPAPRPTKDRQPSASTHFFWRQNAPRLLLLLVVYKTGDALATGMLRPFLTDVGLGLADIGVLLGTVGFVAGLAGALAGGALVNRLGRRPALVAFGIAQALTVGGYAWIAFVTPPLDWLYAVCAAEHFAGGMATAALFTCMMDWCRKGSNATDYTVQACAVVIATGTASSVSGLSADALGYHTHFALAALLSMLGVAAAAGLFPRAGVRTPHDAPHGQQT